MAEASPYRETCPSCKELHAQVLSEKALSKKWYESYTAAEERQRNHSCWSLGKETDGSSAMDIISTVALLGAIVEFAAAAHGTTRWSVGAVLLAGAAFCRLWGISFRIW